MNWIKVCALKDIAPDTGVCALVAGMQVAIFRQAMTDRLFAVGNFDPIGKANVLSRGLMAQLGDKLAVASPLYKQHYNLATGECLEDAEVNIPVFEVHHRDGWVEVKAA